MSVTRDMKTYLISKGVSEHIFLGKIPDGETECISLYKHEGQTFLRDAGVWRVGLQVRCRAANYEEAVADIRLVCSLLWEIGGEENGYKGVLDIDGTKYLRVCPMQSICPLGQNENEKYEMVQDFEVYVLP